MEANIRVHGVKKDCVAAMKLYRTASSMLTIKRNLTQFVFAYTQAKKVEKESREKLKSLGKKGKTVCNENN